jgi:hypothetical protein
MAGISSASFYRIVWKTISAINSCTWPFLGRCLVVGFDVFFFNGVIDFDGGLHDDVGIINDDVGRLGEHAIRLCVLGHLVVFR